MENTMNGRKECILNVEILMQKESDESDSVLRKELIKFLDGSNNLTLGAKIKKADLPDKLKSLVEEIIICETVPHSENKHVKPSDVEFRCFLYRLDTEGGCVEEMDSNDNDDNSPGSVQWLLPSKDFHSLWDNLIYDSQIKEHLLNFAHTTLFLSDIGIDPNVIAWNKVLLLHGPPGTGKTSLCRALAHKLSIRLSNRYDHSVLVEVNSHSLFSKWFSESGKLVQKLFSTISEHLENPRAMVYVLIDEVESLAKCRNSGSNEPSDGVRAVNALLTQIDYISRYPNVLILTTSNITGQIDLAFVDRADIKQYIGMPTTAAIYQIYYLCIQELMQKGGIYPKEKLLNHHQLDLTNNQVESSFFKPSQMLWKIAEESNGLSGRSLKKIPFLTIALQLNSRVVSLECFLDAMLLAVKKHKKDEEQLKNRI